MTWLITGGAGYIGSHVVRATLASGRSAVVLDDMSTGVAARIPHGVALEEVTLTDAQMVEQVFKTHPITGVLHLAAKKQVAESVSRPEYYWEQNVRGLINLLDAMVTFGVDRFVFSSSASVYGQPSPGANPLIDESAECLPISPYGATKLVGEWLTQAHTVAHGTAAVALRYFNVAGAGADDLGDVFELNLIPIVLAAITSGRTPRIFGDDYPTADGTCVRDYVHVQDLADAHVAAMDFVEHSGQRFEAVNIGTGQGASVRQVIDALSQATGIDIHAEVVDRRPGDPTELVAAVGKAADLLGWRARHDLSQIAASAWRAWQV